MKNDARTGIPGELDFRSPEFDLFASPFYLIAHADFHYHEDLDRAAARFGLDRTAYRLLTTLHRRSPLNIKDLAHYALVKRSTATRALTRLKDAGMVSQSIDSTDSRIVNVNLTELGRETAGKILQLGDRQLARAIEGISEERLRELTTTLRQLVVNLTKLPID
ncbi:MarR family winged helix-turn-helix transcriptional regulator [Parahaliea aestuarii]|uniref:MarR family transcriptional regulator n=1 Tax=Parahaliea aestuarii TaxID=1852021 RepID=A0A5C9A225_9GAMM|nr:MarR family transcriptional regulator [Parahaliea aestuarii]TXS94933.1 MarR family transcriptional regulator [Parahaliea aestuarii]